MASRENLIRQARREYGPRNPEYFRSPYILTAGLAGFGGLVAATDTPVRYIGGVGLLSVGISCTAEIAFHNHREKKALKARFNDSMQYLLSHSESEEDEQRILRAAQYLPPGGAKVLHPAMEPHEHIRLKPAVVQETLAEEITQTANEVKTDSETPVVVQLTTLGGHTDTFKTAALTMLAAHPYGEDWEHPLFNTWWGSMGPMVHGGGGESVTINKHWELMLGRTDYLMRLPPPNKQTYNSFKQFVAHRARFYQRASFAAHCEESLMQKYYPGMPIALIPEGIREKGAEIWRNYEAFIHTRLFGPAGIEEVVYRPWFGPLRKIPVNDGRGIIDRHEVEYSSIRQSLEDVETAKEQDASFVLRASACMDYLSDQVDDLLGLPISSRNFSV